MPQLMNVRQYASLLTGLVSALTLPTFSQPVITSFTNGVLVCTNLAPGTTAWVEWSSSLDPEVIWQDLESGTVAQDGTIQVTVPVSPATAPRFYRVRGTGWPAYMALIPAGSFTMGDSLDGTSSALPLHSVSLSAFYMDKYEVTKALWGEVYDWATNHGYVFDYRGRGRAANHPVHTVSWYDAVKWCNARSEKEGKPPAYYTDAGQTIRYQTGQVAPFVNWNTGYRLPTEAEWEKAARGGASGHRFPWSDTDNITHSRANYYSDAYYSYDTSSTGGYHPTFYDPFSIPVIHFYTSPVGYFPPNGYGLYDMAGNVSELCWDWNGPYSSESQNDPRGPSSGTYRVARGGSWNYYAIYCRTANREPRQPQEGAFPFGFRAVLPPGQ